MVDRFNGQLKASLRAADYPEKSFPWSCWALAPSSLGSDIDCFAVELVFGVIVQLPGQMISPTPRVTFEDPTNLLHRLQQFMRALSPVPPRPSVSESLLEEELATCSHVSLRCDRVRGPLQPSYDAPPRVNSRGTMNFRIQRETRDEVVSVDLLKAAVPNTPLDEPCSPLPLVHPRDPLFPVPCTSSVPLAVTPNCNYLLFNLQHRRRRPYSLFTCTPYISPRGGRHVHFVDRLVSHDFRH
ncbi:hypothetical protein SprV_0802552900 [Sparganum proliferum]